MVFAQDAAQLRRDPLREVAGDAAADPHDLKMRDRAQPLEEVLDAPVGEEQRVAARHDHVADLVVLLEVAERRLELRHGDLARVPDFAAPRAEATVGSAHGRDEEQGAVGIAVRDVGHRRVGVLGQRIHEPVVHFELLEVRHVLAPDRIAGGLDQVHHGRRDPELKVLGRLPQTLEIREMLGAELGHERIQGREAPLTQ